MREYINLIQQLSEAATGLSAGELMKYDWRFNKFIEYITKNMPFTTVDGEEVVIDPREAVRFKNLYKNGALTGQLKARIKGSDEEIPLSKLAKTKDFGGAAVAVGQDASEAGKEGLVTKPSQIGITDRDIPASDFYDTIAQNSALQATDYGQVIIQLADYIISGEVVMLPVEYTKSDKEKVRKSIVDYAGEYLGVLALLYGRSRFPKRAQFEEWLGADIGDLTLNFPSKANTNLADSFASIKNPSTNHTLNISSKGTGGGAAPAISGLKVPDYIRQDPKFEYAVKFIDICQQEGTIQQAFTALDLIYSINPKAVNNWWHKYLPFAEKNPKLMDLCMNSIAGFKRREEIPLPKKYQPIVDSVNSAGTAGGKVVYAIKKEVADAINHRDAVPEFKTAILQILEMNFIQQYTDYSRGQLTFATQWPAKLDGEISVENKSSAKEPTAGGFSFKLGRVDDSVSGEPGEEPVDDLGSEEDFTAAASSIAGGVAEPKAAPAARPQVGNVGRKKR